MRTPATFGRAALAAAAILAVPASAQPRHYPIDEIAADLAYGFCPLFLAGQFPLDSPQLAERGFGKTISKQPHPRVGEVSMVSARHADGEVSFGGAAGKACSVTVIGAKRAQVLARLKDNMSYMGLDFQPAENPGPSVAGLSVQTFRAPVEGQFLYVQLVETGGPQPAVVVQLFATEA